MDDALVNIALDFALVEHVQVVFQQAAFLGQSHFHLFAGQHANEHPLFARGRAGFGLGRRGASCGFFVVLGLGVLDALALLAAPLGGGHAAFGNGNFGSGVNLVKSFVVGIPRAFHSRVVHVFVRCGIILAHLACGGLAIFAVAPATAAPSAPTFAPGSVSVAVVLVSGGGFFGIHRGLDLFHPFWRETLGPGNFFGSLGRRGVSRGGGLSAFSLRRWRVGFGRGGGNSGC